jgi:hypothetical protein
MEAAAIIPIFIIIFIICVRWNIGETTEEKMKKEIKHNYME